MAAILALAGRASLVFGAPAVLRDRTFADADWSITTFVTGDGGDVEDAQTAPGNPPPSRYVRTAVNASPSPTESSAVTGVSLHAGMTYDPSAEGPLASVDYFEQARLVQGFGDGQATGIALRQDGKVYVAHVGTTPDFAWTPKEALGLFESGFIRVVDGGFETDELPDFSAGGEIEFGFYRANSTSPGAIGFETIALIDNWTVLLNPSCDGDDDCVYPDACFVGTCVAGACRATPMACDDGDPCTTDLCTAGVCQTAPACDDGDPCTTDACDAGTCSVTSVAGCGLLLVKTDRRAAWGDERARSSICQDRTGPRPRPLPARGGPRGLCCAPPAAGSSGPSGRPARGAANASFPRRRAQGSWRCSIRCGQT
jgi:hypothetical protein